MSMKEERGRDGRERHERTYKVRKHLVHAVDWSARQERIDLSHSVHFHYYILFFVLSVI